MKERLRILYGRRKLHEDYIYDLLRCIFYSISITRHGTLPSGPSGRSLGLPMKTTELQAEHR